MPRTTNTHSECAILIAFPLQQWLHERALMLRYTYIVGLFALRLWNFAPHKRASLQWLKNYQVLKKYVEAYHNNTMNTSESTASNGAAIIELSYA
jgi:hypothetical protein